ncbi:hypothetical protein ACFXJJ_39140, partial [Streptomyces sp. NPDC059233]
MLTPAGNGNNCRKTTANGRSSQAAGVEDYLAAGTCAGGRRGAVTARPTGSRSGQGAGSRVPHRAQ